MTQVPERSTFTPRQLGDIGFCSLGVCDALAALGIRSSEDNPILLRSGYLSDDFVIGTDDFCARVFEAGGEKARIVRQRWSYFRRVARFLGFEDTEDKPRVVHLIEYGRLVSEAFKKPQLINPRRVSELVGR